MLLLYLYLLEITLGRRKIKRLGKSNWRCERVQKNMTAVDVAKKSFQFKRLWRELPNRELSSDKILHRKGDENN